MALTKEQFCSLNQDDVIASPTYGSWRVVSPRHELSDELAVLIKQDGSNKSFDVFWKDGKGITDVRGVPFEDLNADDVWLQAEPLSKVLGLLVRGGVLNEIQAKRIKKAAGNDEDRYRFIADLHD